MKKVETNQIFPLKTIEISNELATNINDIEEDELDVKKVLFSKGSKLTTHGIRRVFDQDQNENMNSNFLRLLWLLATMASTCYCFYLCVNIIFEYYEYKTTTQYMTREEKVLAFPKV
jgi:hypothetical protein